ncbi:hypothetical protein Poly30_45220 [Planctomycetes bacterium Poly30]|uniref:Right handed beta helix domain-containing protein n=1 Tax=Saltatorellus ferox TaxID=2528018 RepID=A0A518EXZ3_9BACT|nr:hypothetical protein Poly30_45220 [Planctomycetes bacterium Poly30]
MNTISMSAAIGALALLAVPSRADVLIVDTDHPAPFRQIQEAIDVAQDGDTIVVRPRVDYRARMDGFVIDGKALTIHGMDAEFLLTGKATIRSIPAGGTVVLRGLDINRRTRDDPHAHDVDPLSPGAPGIGLVVAECAGAVSLQSCSVEGGFISGWTGGPSQGGIELVDVSSFSAVDCRLRGGAVSTGMRIVRSRATLYRSDVFGGIGLGDTGYNPTSGDGALGVDVRGRSFLWIGDSSIEGGPGGIAYCIGTGSCPATVGDGGTGMTVESASQVYSLASVVRGGPVGYTDPSFGWIDNPPSIGVALTGQIDIIPGAQRSVQCAPMVASGSSLPMTFTGLEGEEVQLLVGGGTAFRFFGSLTGAFMVRDLLQVSPQGSWPTMPGSGSLARDITLPQVAAGEVRTMTVQAFFRSPGSMTRFRISNPQTVTVFGAGVPIP